MLTKPKPTPYHIGRIVFKSGDEARVIIDSPDTSGVISLLAGIKPLVKAVKAERIIQGKSARMNTTMMKILDAFYMVDREPLFTRKGRGMNLQMNQEAAKA
jgi:hypothetical protein